MKKDCTTCNSAEFERTKSGRRNLGHGKCGALVKLPHSFHDYRNEFPLRKHISKHTKPDCPLWKKDESPEKIRCSFDCEERGIKKIDWNKCDNCEFKPPF